MFFIVFIMRLPPCTKLQSTITMRFAESQHILQSVGGEFLNCDESTQAQHTGYRSLHVLPVSKFVRL